MPNELLDNVRQKYPQYANMPDADLAKALVTKYPQYQSALAPVLSGSVPQGTGPVQNGPSPLAQGIMGAISGGGPAASKMAIGTVPIVGQLANDVMAQGGAGLAQSQLGLSSSQGTKRVLGDVTNQLAQVVPMVVGGIGPAGLLARTAVTAGVGAGVETIRHYVNRSLGLEDAKTPTQVAKDAALVGGIQGAVELVPGLASRGAGRLIGAKTLAPELAASRAVAREFELSPKLGLMRDSVDAAVEKTISQVRGNPTNAGQVGGGVQDILDIGKQNFKNEVGAMFDDVQNLVGPRPVDTTQLGKEATAVYASLARARESGSPNIGALSKEVSGLLADSGALPPGLPASYANSIKAKPLTWEQAQARRSIMIDLAKSGDKTVASTAKRLLPALTESMDNTAAAAGKDVANLWQSARDQFAEGSDVYNNRLVSQLTQKAPEEVVGSILQNPDRARTVMTALKDAGIADAKTALQRQTLQEVVAPKGGDPDYFGLHKRLAQHQDILNIVMDSPEGQTALNNLKRLSDVTSKLPELKIGAEGSAQKTALSGVIDAGVSGMMGRLYRLPYAAAKIFTKPIYTNMLLNGKSTSLFAGALQSLADGSMEKFSSLLTRAVYLAASKGKPFNNDAERKQFIDASTVPDTPPPTQ